MRIARDQLKSPQTLQVGMRRHGVDEPLAEPFSSVLREHVDVTKIRERRAIRDDAREADLRSIVEQSEAQGVSDRTRDQLLRNAFCPERAAEKRVNRADVEPGRVR